MITINNFALMSYVFKCFEIRQDPDYLPQNIASVRFLKNFRKASKLFEKLAALVSFSLAFRN